MPSATIVSICPFDTIENKPGLAHPRYLIPRCPKGDFVIVHVRDSWYDVRLPATNQKIRVPQPGEQIAKSIIDDFCNCHVQSSENCHPGMFWLPGLLTKEAVVRQHADELKSIKEIQHRWFIALVQQADDDWNRWHNGKMINGNQRYACTALGLERDWNLDLVMPEDVNRCPACKNPVDPEAALCGTCDAVLDESKFKKIKFGKQFAAQLANPQTENKQAAVPTPASALMQKA